MKAVALCLSLAIIFAAGDSLAQSTHIPRAQLDTMFADMRARAPWNVDGDLLWGYFFISPYRNQLDKAADELAAKGYRVVDIRQVAPERWGLHVEKVEHHTAESLFNRNEELYIFAAAHMQMVYDGMDVGPVQ